MSIKQKIKQLAIMREMLADMRQEREEAKVKYSESSEFMQQLDADRSLAITTIRGCERVIKEKR